MRSGLDKGTYAYYDILPVSVLKSLTVLSSLRMIFVFHFNYLGSLGYHVTDVADFRRG